MTKFHMKQHTNLRLERLEEIAEQLEHIGESSYNWRTATLHKHIGILSEELSLIAKDLHMNISHLPTRYRWPVCGVCFSKYKEIVAEKNYE